MRSPPRLRSPPTARARMDCAQKRRADNLRPAGRPRRLPHPAATAGPQPASGQRRRSPPPCNPPGSVLAALDGGALDFEQLLEADDSEQLLLEGGPVGRGA